MRLTSNFILSAVADASGVPPEVLKGRDRTKQVAQVRQVCYLLIKEFTRFSLPEIGRFFSDRDHTTVMVGVRKARTLISDGHEVSIEVYRAARAEVLRVFPLYGPCTCPLCGCEVAQ